MLCCRGSTRGRPRWSYILAYTREPRLTLPFAFGRFFVVGGLKIEMRRRPPLLLCQRHYRLVRGDKAVIYTRRSRGWRSLSCILASEAARPPRLGRKCTGSPWTWHDKKGLHRWLSEGHVVTSTYALTSFWVLCNLCLSWSEPEVNCEHHHCDIET